MNAYLPHAHQQYNYKRPIYLIDNARANQDMVLAVQGYKQ